MTEKKAGKPVVTIDLNTKSILISLNRAEDIESIKNSLKLKDSGVHKIGDVIYELKIPYDDVDMPIVQVGMTFGEMKKQINGATVPLPDFRNASSEDFYKQTTAKKPKYKIISDEYSDARNRELYRGFQIIEQELRKQIVKNDLELDKSESFRRLKNNYKSDHPDHRIATISLGELLENYLGTPSSEEYMKMQWERSERKTGDEVVRIAKLTRLDEFNLGISRENLKTIADARNQCMHFRVMTVSEYEEIVKIINRYMVILSNRHLRETLELISNISLTSASQLVDSMKGFIKPISIQEIIDSISSVTSSMPVPSLQMSRFDLSSLANTGLANNASLNYSKLANKDVVKPKKLK